MAIDLERVVTLDHEGRQFTFRVDHDPPLAFWRVESEGRVCHLPITVSGDEQPDFFRSLVKFALEHFDR